ncbi:hypothetical protein [Streptomyces mayteni]
MGKKTSSSGRRWRRRGRQEGADRAGAAAAREVSRGVLHGLGSAVARIAVDTARGWLQ